MRLVHLPIWVFPLSLLLVVGRVQASDHQEKFAAFQKVLETHCVRCHGGPEPSGNLSLRSDDSYRNITNVPAAGDSSSRLIEPNNVLASYLFRKINGKKSELPFTGDPMPREAGPISMQEKEVVRDFINSYPQGLWGPVVEGVPVAFRDDEPQGDVFFGTQLITLPTNRTLERFSSEFKLIQRYGDFRLDSFAGIDDDIDIDISFSFAPLDRMEIAWRRDSFVQDQELFVRYRFLQTDSPLVFSAGGLLGFDRIQKKGLEHPFSVNAQAIFSAATANRRLAVLVVPTFISSGKHVGAERESSTAVGLGFQFRVFGDVALIGEIIPTVAGHSENHEYWGVGLSARAGWHVFMLTLTNTRFMHFNQTAAGTSNNAFSGGERYLGVSIFRKFGYR